MALPSGWVFNWRHAEPVAQPIELDEAHGCQGSICAQPDDSGQRVVSFQGCNADRVRGPALSCNLIPTAVGDGSLELLPGGLLVMPTLDVL